MRYLAALGAAIALVASAVVIRSLVIDDGPDAAGPDTPASATMTIGCSAELGDICSALRDAVDSDVDVVSVDPTKVASPDDTEAWDAWLTTDVWGDLVASVPALEGSLFVGSPLATAELGLIAPNADAQTLTQTCGDPLTWSCVATSGSSAGAKGVSLGAVNGTEALLAATSLTMELMGGADFSANDIGFDVTDALEDLEGGPTVGDHLRGFTVRPSGASAAIGFATASALDTAAGRANFTRLALEPKAVAGLVLVTKAGADAEAAADAVTAAWSDEGVVEELAASGWDADVSANPVTDRPAPAVVAEIRARWNEVQ